MKFQFLPYQRRWLEDNARLKLMEKSRQTGLTLTEAYFLTRVTSAKDNKLDAWVSSRDEIQAQLFLQDCKSWVRPLEVGAQDLGERVIDKEKDLRAFSIRFANGYAINSMSSNPDAQAGKRGRRTLDEFALHKDQETLYAIAQPGLMWGGSMSIISTHRGGDSFFNRLITEVREKGNPKKISLHRVTIEDAVAQGLLEKIQAKIGPEDPRLDMSRDEFLQSLKDECADQESWLQEYMCVPANDAAAFLEYHLITNAEYPSGEPWEKPLADCGDLYLGMDVGRKKDLTVLWIAEKFGDVFFTRKVHVLAKTPFSIQEKILHDYLALKNLRRACLDATGLGMQLAENAHTRYPGKVEPITFTNTMKSELAFPLRGALEDRRWRIPDDKTIRTDLRAVRKEITPSGNIRFLAESDEINGHADRFWALALCHHAGETFTTPGRFALPGRRPDRDSGRARARHRRSLTAA